VIEGHGASADGTDLLDRRVREANAQNTTAGRAGCAKEENLHLRKNTPGASGLKSSDS
jgi:hypothetical protein